MLANQITEKPICCTTKTTRAEKGLWVHLKAKRTNDSKTVSDVSRNFCMAKYVKKK